MTVRVVHCATACQRSSRVLVVNDTQEVLELFHAILGGEKGLETIPKGG